MSVLRSCNCTTRSSSCFLASCLLCFNTRPASTSSTDLLRKCLLIELPHDLDLQEGGGGPLFLVPSSDTDTPDAHVPKADDDTVARAPKEAPPDLPAALPEASKASEASSGKVAFRFSVAAPAGFAGLPQKG